MCVPVCCRCRSAHLPAMVDQPPTSAIHRPVGAKWGEDLAPGEVSNYVLCTLSQASASKLHAAAMGAVSAATCFSTGSAAAGAAAPLLCSITC
jgi:hypothetical protein